MGSVNKAIILGNLGRDPELKYTADGRAVARFSVATSDAWTSREGEKKEKTEWHKIVAWGKTAEICGEYLRKGRQVYLEGRIETRSYEDRDKQQRYITEIIAQRVVLLASRGGSDEASASRGGAASAPSPAAPAAPAGYDNAGPTDATDGSDYGSEDDVPF